MARLIEAALLLAACGVGFTSFIGYLKAKKKPTAPDKCKHRRWSQWKIEQLKQVHLYSEVDEGKDLPDRVDAYMTRTCVTCGLTQAKTVRGIDSQRFK